MPDQKSFISKEDIIKKPVFGEHGGIERPVKPDNIDDLQKPASDRAMMHNVVHEDSQEHMQRGMSEMWGKGKKLAEEAKLHATSRAHASEERATTGGPQQGHSSTSGDTKK